MKAALIRWKYRFICWFYNEPDSLSRRVEVENVLLTHYKKKTSPTPEECKNLALKLGIPEWFKSGTVDSRDAQG